MTMWELGDPPGNSYSFVRYRNFLVRADFDREILRFAQWPIYVAMSDGRRASGRSPVRHSERK
jgi:hypothetical protein